MTDDTLQCGLDEAEDYFAQALGPDAGNVTANQRVAAIELAGGGYDAALAYAQAAYERDEKNRVTWQLLGDAHLAPVQVDEAYTVWSSVDGAEAKLQEEAWVRYEKNGDRERAGWAKALAERVRLARRARE